MGKLAPDDLRKVLSHIKKTAKVIVPPMPGFDSGVHEIGDDLCMVIATDPCIGVPREWFGWFLIHYSASDVALFGAKPQFCTVNLLGPPKTKSTIFMEVMRQACDAADELDMTIITGHTGTYDGLTTLVASCTAYGLIQRSNLITPAGAKPDDYILCSKPIGFETLINFVLTHKTLAEKLFGPKQTQHLAEQVKMQTCVKEALLLAKTGGVSAMHDATEGGFVAALNEIADASNVGFSIDSSKLPLTQELQKLTQQFRLTHKQIMSMSSTGTLLAAVSPSQKDRIVDMLSSQGFDAKIVGVFSETEKRLIEIGGKEVEFPREPDDPYVQIVLK